MPYPFVPSHDYRYLGKNTKRILIVDDDDDLLKKIAGILKEAGYPAFSTVNRIGHALTLLETDVYDLVVTDLLVDVRDGCEVIDSMRIRNKWRDVPIIVITGNSTTARAVAARTLGVADYLTKPVDRELLLAAIEAALSRHSASWSIQNHLQQTEIRRARAENDVLKFLLGPAYLKFKQNGTLHPEKHENVGILFCDIVGFTEKSERCPIADTVAMLNAYFSISESTSRSHGLIKIKTNGDELFTTAGLLSPSPTPLLDCLNGGIAIIDALVANNFPLPVRIGIFEGPVMAGIIGDQPMQFDVWGATVNRANRLTKCARPQNVALLKEQSFALPLEFQRRGEIREVDLPGIGLVEVFEIAKDTIH